MPTMIEPAALSDVIGETQTPGAQEYGDPGPDVGELLGEKDLEKVAKRVLKLWTSQDPLLQRDLAQWRVNELRRKGYSQVQLVKVPDKGWREWLPPNASPDQTPVVNKTATLCRRTTAMLFADPPAADARPPSGEDEDVKAAELASRILEDLQGSDALNTQGRSRRAFDRAATCGSGFIHYWMDRMGGGRQPIQVEASPYAQHAEFATEDPETGEPYPQPYVSRYVRKDGTLTDELSEAATRWVPQLKSEVLTGRNIRFIPHTAEDLWDADAVMVGAFVAWGELKKLWPEELKSLEANERDAILKYQPKQAEDMLPSGHRGGEEAEDNTDEKLCFVLTLYQKECPAYPKGAHLVVLGGKKVVHRGEWGAEVNGKFETFLLPVTQFKHLDEGDDSPYGHGQAEIVGAGGELRAAIWGSYLDHLDALGNRKTFIPVNSIVHPDELESPGKNYVHVNEGGQPWFEDLPEFPRTAPDALDRISDEMDNAASIESVAQGLQDASVESGRHAYAIISQVHAAMSELKQNAERGYIRSCMIELQLVRAFYDTPRQLEWTGEDGEHRQKAWAGSDLKSTKDVRIKPGTMTMLSTAAKADLAEKYAGMGFLQPHELRSMIASNVGGTIGLQDDPHLLRIRRQLGVWQEGPPEDWQPPQPAVQVDPSTGAMLLGPDGAPVPQVDPVTGQPIPTPPDPVLVGIFDMNPADGLPEVAGVRLTEIARVMASKSFSRWSETWQEGLVKEFFRMRQVLATAQQPAQPMAAPPPAAE